MSPLREARIEAGLSARELAGRVGIREDQLSRYERGAQVPRIETACKLADELHCSLDTVYGRKGMSDESVKLMLFNAYKRMSMRQKRKLLSFARYLMWEEAGNL